MLISSMLLEVQTVHIASTLLLRACAFRENVFSFYIYLLGTQILTT